MILLIRLKLVAGIDAPHLSTEIICRFLTFFSNFPYQPRLHSLNIVTKTSRLVNRFLMFLQKNFYFFAFFLFCAIIYRKSRKIRRFPSSLSSVFPFRKQPPRPRRFFPRLRSTEYRTSCRSLCSRV